MAAIFVSEPEEMFNVGKNQEENEKQDLCSEIIEKKIREIDDQYKQFTAAVLKTGLHNLDVGDAISSTAMNTPVLKRNRSIPNNHSNAVIGFTRTGSQCRGDCSKTCRQAQISDCDESDLCNDVCCCPREVCYADKCVESMRESVIQGMFQNKKKKVQDTMADLIRQIEISSEAIKICQTLRQKHFRQRCDVEKEAITYCKLVQRAEYEFMTIRSQICRDITFDRYCGDSRVQQILQCEQKLENVRGEAIKKKFQLEACEDTNKRLRKGNEELKSDIRKMLQIAHNFEQEICCIQNEVWSGCKGPFNPETECPPESCPLVPHKPCPGPIGPPTPGRPCPSKPFGPCPGPIGPPCPSKPDPSKPHKPCPGRPIKPEVEESEPEESEPEETEPEESELEETEPEQSEPEYETEYETECCCEESEQPTDPSVITALTTPTSSSSTVSTSAPTSPNISPPPSPPLSPSVTPPASPPIIATPGSVSSISISSPAVQISTPSIATVEPSTESDNEIITPEPILPPPGAAGGIDSPKKAESTSMNLDSQGEGEEEEEKGQDYFDEDDSTDPKNDEDDGDYHDGSHGPTQTMNHDQNEDAAANDKDRYRGKSCKGRNGCKCSKRDRPQNDDYKISSGFHYDLERITEESEIENNIVSEELCGQGSLTANNRKTKTHRNAVTNKHSSRSGKPPPDLIGDHSEFTRELLILREEKKKALRKLSQTTAKSHHASRYPDYELNTESNINSANAGRQLGKHENGSGASFETTNLASRKRIRDVSKGRLSSATLVRKVDYLTVKLKASQNKLRQYKKNNNQMLRDQARAENLAEQIATLQRQNAELISRIENLSGDSNENEIVAGVKANQSTVSSNQIHLDIDNNLKHIQHITKLERIIANLSDQNASNYLDYLESQNLVKSYQKDLTKCMHGLFKPADDKCFCPEPSAGSKKRDWIKYAREAMQVAKATQLRSNRQSFALKVAMKENKNIVHENDSLQHKLQIYVKNQKHFLDTHMDLYVKSETELLTHELERFKAVADEYEKQKKESENQIQRLTDELKTYMEKLQTREQQLEAVNNVSLEEISKLKHNNEKLSEELKQEKAEVDKLSIQLQSSNRDLDEYKKEVEKSKLNQETDRKIINRLIDSQDSNEVHRTNLSTSSRQLVKDDLDLKPEDSRCLQAMCQSLQYEIQGALRHIGSRAEGEIILTELRRIYKSIDILNQRFTQSLDQECLNQFGSATARKQDPQLHRICMHILMHGIAALEFRDLVHLHYVVYNAGMEFQKKVKQGQLKRGSSISRSSLASTFSPSGLVRWHQLEKDVNKTQEILRSLQKHGKK